MKIQVHIPEDPGQSSGKGAAKFSFVWDKRYWKVEEQMDKGRNSWRGKTLLWSE